MEDNVYSIHKVDPTKIYLVKDLYSLCEDKIMDLPKTIALKTILESRLYTVEELATLFNKPLHTLNESELKFVYLLFLHKYKDLLRHSIKGNGKPLSDKDKIVLCDGVDTVLCFYDELKKSDLSRYKYRNHILLDNSELQKELENYCHYQRHNVEHIIIEPLPFADKDYTPYRRVGFPSRYRQPNDVIHYKRCTKYYISISDLQKYRSPFLEEVSMYPKFFTEDTAGLRLRDLLTIDFKNNKNRWMTFAERNAGYLALNVEEFIEYLLKPEHQWEEKDLNNIELVLKNTESYSSYLRGFRRVKSRFISKIKMRNL